MLMFGYADGGPTSLVAREIVNEAFALKRRSGTRAEDEPCAVCIAMEIAEGRLGPESPDLAAVMYEAVRRLGELA